LLIVIGRVAGRPDRRHELIELLTWMQNESDGEPGCLRYGFSESVEVENEFIAVEEWESVEALRTHFAAPSVERFTSEAADLVVGLPEVRIHGVAATTDFPDLTPFE
jgi:quinol monooxygenase YgiN